VQSAEQQWRPYVAVSERRRKWGECGEQAWLGTCVTRHEQKVKRELRGMAASFGRNSKLSVLCDRVCLMTKTRRTTSSVPAFQKGHGLSFAV